MTTNNPSDAPPARIYLPLDAAQGWAKPEIREGTDIEYALVTPAATVEREQEIRAEVWRDAIRVSEYATETMRQFMEKDLQVTASQPAPTAEAECEWLPIASAPKDGSRFIAAEVVPAKLTSGQGDMPHVFVGYWWQGDNLNTPRFVGGFDKPTHWQPLPAPPSSQRLKEIK